MTSHKQKQNRVQGMFCYCPITHIFYYLEPALPKSNLLSKGSIQLASPMGLPRQNLRSPFSLSMLLKIWVPGLYAIAIRTTPFGSQLVEKMLPKHLFDEAGQAVSLVVKRPQPRGRDKLQTLHIRVQRWMRLPRLPTSNSTPRIGVI